LVQAYCTRPDPAAALAGAIWGEWEMAETEAPVRVVGRATYDMAKQRHPGVLLIFRAAKICKMLCDDAETASPLLGITLSRWSEYSPTVFITFQAADLERHLRALLAAGHKVAICDPVQETHLR